MRIGSLIAASLLASIVISSMAISGCASAPSVPSGPAMPTMPSTPSAPSSSSDGLLGMISSATDAALAAVGLKKPDVPPPPEIPDSAMPDYKVNWRVYASESLNVDERGHALALVVRIYKLKSPDAFLQASYDTFGDAAKEKAVLGDDLVGVRELQLVPNQHHEATDKVAREARYIGIVALYKNALAGRWRYAFSTAAADKTGLTIGAHACALSIQVGEAIGQAASTVRSVAMPCP